MIKNTEILFLKHYIVKYSTTMDDLDIGFEGVSGLSLIENDN